MLDDRKLKVLYAIISSYITNGEPIGSRTISKKYNLGVSSATIRNEMSDLEELGYLNKPYTSAGRIPSDKAYRLYVDTLMKNIRSDIDSREKAEIKNNLMKEVMEIDQLIQNSAKILSKITNYTSIAITPQINQSTLKHIQLIPIDNNEILIIIVNDSGIVRNTIFKMDENISEEQLTAISNFLNSKLKGLTLDKVSREIDTVMLKELYDFRNVVGNIIPIINQSLDEIEDVEIFADGMMNIFNFPEYKDIAKAKTLLSFIEDKDLMVGILLKDFYNDIEITIGDENSYDELKDCSLITATYKFDGNTVGKIGVIGPTRMDYINAINAVNLLSLNISEILDKYFQK
jgi:heat-inducible transcriptional repressor